MQPFPTAETASYTPFSQNKKLILKQKKKLAYLCGKISPHIWFLYRKTNLRQSKQNWLWNKMLKNNLEGISRSFHSSEHCRALEWTSNPTWPGDLCTQDVILFLHFSKYPKNDLSEERGFTNVQECHCNS